MAEKVVRPWPDHRLRPCKLLLHPAREVAYCGECVCQFVCGLSVCLSMSISPELQVQSSPDFLHLLPMAVASLPCDALCNSTFGADVMFAVAHNGQ